MFETQLSREKMQSILENLNREFEKIFTDQLEGIYLYGSRARGDARPDSDIDILVVLKNNFDYADALRKTIDVVAALSLENDVVISRAFVSKERFEREHSPFLNNVRREAVAL